MGSLMSAIRDEHREFESWCEHKGYEVPYREYWEHPNFKEWEDYKDPPEAREKRKQEWEDRKNLQKDKVGILPLDTWYNAEISKYSCEKCGVGLIYKVGWILSDEYGCPGCGHTEGGEW